MTEQHSEMHNHNPESTSSLSYSTFGKLLDIQFRNARAVAMNQPQNHHSMLQQMRATSSSSQNSVHVQSRLSATMGKIVKPRSERNTTAFTSVSRDKKGNFRFPVRLCRQEIKYHPDYFMGRETSPQWTMAKAEKGGARKLVEQYQICEKSPLKHQIDQIQKMGKTTATTSLLKKQRQPILKRSLSNSQGSVKDNWAKSTMQGSLIEQPEHKHHHDSNNKNHDLVAVRSASVVMNRTTASVKRHRYSILQQRENSLISRFNKTKIRIGSKVSREEIMKAEEKERLQNQKIPLAGENIFVSFDRQKVRAPNLVHQECLTQSQFNNSLMYNNYDVSEHVHSFDQYLSREDIKPDQSPVYNILEVNMNKVKENLLKGNFRFKTFRDKIKVRQDRAEPQPNTRLNYDYPLVSQGHIHEPRKLEYNKMLGRPKDLFPIVDYAIKRESDKIITKQLKSRINKSEDMGYIL